MNGPFQVAQASGTGGSNSGAPPRVFKLTKPLGDQAVVVNLGYDQKVQVDFSSIANEKITLVHIGEKLIILFDNKATVTVEPFFDSRHDALNNLTIEIAPGRDVTVSEFASLFPITDDQSVLPAAGDGNGNAQGSGADFSTAAVDPLAIGNPLDLLGQEELGNFQVGGQQFLVTPTVIIQPTIAVAVGPAVALAGVQSLVVDESFIPVIGSQQGPAGSNVATETFAPVFTVTTQTGVQSETFGLTIGNATTNLIDSVSGQIVHLVQIGAGEVDGVVTVGGVQTTVFTLAVDTTGHITMTELRAVHELTPGDFNEGINLGSGMVSLTLTVIDNNNESVSASFDLGPHLTILDDGPILSVTAPAAINGLDFGTFALNGNIWGVGSGTATGTNGGWTIADANQGHNGADLIGNTGSGIVQLERVGDGYEGMHSSTAGFMVDLDASPHDVKISQTITGLVDGQTYDLRFEAGAPFPGDAHLEVWFGGTKVGDIAPTGQMQEFEIQLIGGSGVDHNNLLEFRETGTPDNQGTFLANVSVGDIVIDETPGIQLDSNEVAPNSLFDLVANKGTDPDMPPQFAAGTTAAVTVTANFGADGPLGGSAATGTVYSLQTTQGTNSGLSTTDGHPISLFNENGFVVGRYDSNNSGTIDGSDNAAFAFRIDPATGVLSLVQYVSLHQPNTASNDEGVFLNTGVLSVTVTITDADGDSATQTADISANIRFDDDGPTLSVSGSSGTVVVDETPGLQSADGATDVHFTSLSTAAQTAFNGVVNKGHDFDVSSGDLDHGALSYAVGSGSILAAVVNFGADGPAPGNNSEVFALTLPSNGVDSGLKTTEGREIFLFQENGVIVGRYDAPNDGNTTVNQSDPAAFAITIDLATGQISLAQYVSLNHPEQATSADGFVSYNEAVSLASGTISISVTATDGDGDTVTGAADISGAIKFLDDGPTVTVSVDHHLQVVLDETPGVQSEDDDTTSSTVRHLFDSVVNTGNDPDVSSADKDHGALGFAIGTNAALDVHAIFGADGPAVHQSEVFSLTLNGVSGSVDSGIQTTEGKEIYLSLENGVIVGRVDTDGDGHVSSTDPAAFAVTVDSTGHVATAEWLSLKHGDPHAFDETVQLATGTVSATVTVTDGDGDQASASADISSKILFEDDAPVAHDVTPNTILDDEAQSLFPPNFGGPGDVSPSLSTVSGGPGTLFDSGADGTKSVTFTPPSGLKAIFELPSGLAGQETVSYATTIVGGHTILTATGDVSHDTVFTLDVSPDGSYTFKVSEPLVDPIHSTTEENLSVKIGFTVTDGDGDQDSGSLTVKVNDDTPTVEVDQAQHDYHDVTLSTLTLDESIGTMAGDPNAATDDVPGVTAPTLLTAVDVTKAIGIISTPTSANGTSVAELFDTSVHFGADGAMAPASFNYSFTLKDDHGNTVSNGSSTGVETNLIVTALAGTPLAGLSDDQRTIYLFKQADGSIVGKIGIGGGGSVPDDIALHIVITGSATDPQITVEQYLPIEHSNHSSSDESTSLTFADHDASLGVTLTVSATDGDGDVATDSKTVSLTDHDNPLIKIEDDGPTVMVSATSATVIHDETPGIQTAADPNPANDVAGASLPTGVLTLFNAITHPGSDPDVTVKDNGAIGFATSASKIVAVTPDFGTDGPAINGSQVLSLQIQGGNNTDSSLQTTNGDHILLRLETYNGVNLIVGRVDGNHDGSVTTADPAAFAIELGQDGNISLAQYLSLKNPLPGSTAADQDEPVLTLQHVQASVTITDGDGDHATQTIDISGSIQFQDDGPTLTVTSPGVINGLDFGNFVLNGDVWGVGSGVATGTNGGWTIADANVGHSGADLIGNTGSGAVQLERVGDGYQGMHSSTDGFMVDLDASPRDVEISQTVNGLAVGQTYDLRFEAGAPFPSDAHLEVWFGGVKVGDFASLSQMQEFEIALTGGSGDGSNVLQFRETGTPDNQGTYIANVSIGEIVIDETPGIQADSNEVAPNTLFDTVANHGTDPDMPPQFAAGLTAVVSVAANFGADGPATTGATVYSLQTTQGMDSGLTTTAGQSIHLFNENGFVVGRYDSNNSGGIDGIDGSDNAAFAFRVDPSTGVLSLVQYVSLHQPNTASNDEGVFLNANALSVSVTVTDGDGDTATKSADVSAVIRFDDDGPTALASATVTAAVDEDGLKPPDLSTGNADAGRTGEVTGTGSDTVSGGAGSLNSLVNFGADGPAAHPFQVASQSDAVTWISGLHLSSQGSSIDNATVVGNTVTALAQDGRAVFSLTVNDDGSWSFKLLDQLDHPLVDNPATQAHEIAFEDTLTLNLGGLIVATDGDGDPVTLNGSGLQITVLDDVPLFGTISTDTVTHLNTITTGTFDFHVGADDFPAGTHPVGEFTVTPPTIAGVDVTTTTDPTTGVITLTGTFHDGGATFYVLTVNPNGTYTFALDSQAAGTTTTQTLADVNLEHSFQPEPVKDFGSFSFIADPGHNVNGSGSGVGIDNDHVGNGEHLTIKFDQEMTTTDFHLDQTGGDPVLVTWVATDSQNPAHTETGTFIVGHDESGATTFTIDTGGVPFDTLSITPTSDKDNVGDLKGSGQIRFISVGGTEVQNANTGPLDFTLTGTDFDGDAATGAIHIVTDIHAPPVVSQNLVADEDDLPAGNHDSAPGDEASVLAGHVSYNLGTDHIGSVSLSTTGGLTDLQTLASQAVDTFWNGSTLIGFVHGTDPSLPADQVFTITVSNTSDTGADYSMTLLQPVKHAISGTEDNTAPFTVNILVTDSIGGTSSTSFTVVVNDDTPVAVASATVVNAVDEDGLQPPDLSTGNADSGRTGEVTGTGSDTVSGAAGSLNSLVNFGGDGPGAHPFQAVGQAAAITWISGLHLSSQGSSIDNATVVGNTVTALAQDGRAVFSLTVNDDGSWSFKLLDQLDHPLVDNPATQAHEIAFEDTLTLNLGGLIVATDGDGDPVTLNGSGLQITVLDDVPLFGTISTDTVTHLNTITTGTFDFHVGADDFPAGTHPVGEFTVTPPTIAGVDVTTTTDPTTGVITLTGTFHDGGATFYVLTVNPNGTYTFALDGQPATTQTLTEVNLPTNFQPAQTVDFGPFSFIADPGNTVNGGGGVGINNDHVGNGEHLTIKFDQEMTVATFHLDPTGGNPVLVTWVATDSHNPGHSETGTFTVPQNGPAFFSIDILAHDGGGNDISQFDTLSITPTSDQNTAGDLKGSGEIRFIGVSGTEITPAVSPGPFDFTLTGTDFDGDAATGTIHIDANIQPPASVSALDAMVSEAGLPPHNSLPAGSGEIADGNSTNNSDHSETATGTIMVTLGDTPSIVTIDNVAVTTVGQTFDGTFGTLTVTSITTTAIGYSYTLTTNSSGDTTHDDFIVKVTDNDNATASATLVVNIVDDVPTANAGPSLTVVETDGVTTGTNLLANDVQGADGAKVTGVDFGDGNGFHAIAASGTTTLTTTNGSYVFQANGTWSFDPNANLNNASGISAGFTYRITDGDGDTSTATQAITINDGAVAPTPAAVTLDLNEAALSTAGATGSNPGLTSEVDNTPALSFTAGSDNLTSFAFTSTAGLVTDLNGTGGQDIFWQLVSGTQIKGFLDAGHTLLAVTLDLSAPASIAAGATGNVTVTATLSDNLQHPDGLLAQISSIGSVGVVATDTDGDVTTGTVNINVQDDVPTAHADAALTLLETAGATSGTNLLVNDTQGADGATVTGVDFGDGQGFHTINASGTTTLTTPNGSYVFQANGTWTFDPVVNASSSNTTGDFTYQITDGDGDTSTATQAVNITNATSSLVITGAISGVVEEEQLPGGIDDTTSGVTPNLDLDTAGNLNITTNVVSGSFASLVTGGVDGTLSFTFASLSGHPAVQTVSDGALTSGGKPVLFAMDSGNLIGYVENGTAGSGFGSGDTKVFTVTLNGTGGYTFTLNAPVNHPIHSPSTEDTIAINLNGFVTVTDSGGPSPGDNNVPLNASITVIDDVPVAVPESASSTEKVAQVVNAAFVLDMSGSIDSTEFSQMMAAVKAAGDEIFANSTAGTKFELVAFGSTALAAGPFTTQAAFDAQVDAWTANRPINSSTDYTVAISNLMNHYTPVAGQNNQVFFLSDGNPNQDTDGTHALSEPTRDNWNSFVNNPLAPVSVTSIGIGDGIDNTPLQQIDVDGHGSPIAVSQFSDLIDTLVTLVGNDVTGNVLANGDGFGADGGRILSITFGGNTYTWNGQTGAGASIAETDSGGLISTITGSSTIQAASTALGGNFTFYFALNGSHVAGDWAYSGPQELTADSNETFAYVLTDNDGDHASAALTISVAAVNDAPVNTVPGAQTTNEDINLVFSSATSNLIKISDVDAGTGNETVTLGVAHGTLHLASTASLTVGGNDTGNVTLTGHVADVNAALDGLTYKGIQDFNGSDTLTITTNDNGNTGSGGAKTDVDTVTITVNSVNDAPTLAATAANSTFTEGTGNNQGAAVAVFSAADANTVEAGQTITGLTLTVGGIHDGANEKIVIDGTSITLGANASGTTSGNGMSFTETITAGVATIVLSKAAGISTANADALINGITFQDTNVNDPTPGDRTFTLTQIKDNGGTANGGVDTTNLTIASTVHVNAIDDAPVNTVPSSQSTNEDVAKVFSTANSNAITVSDVDDTNVTVTLTGANGAISLNGTAGLAFTTGDGTADATMTFSGTQAAINTALNGLSFAPTANFNGAASIQVVTSDGTLSDTDTVTITVNPVNDAPVNTVPVAQSTNEDTNLVFSSATSNLISITDVDAGSGNETVTLGVAHGTLHVAPAAGLNLSNNDTGTVTLTGDIAHVNAALNGLIYKGVQDFNGSDTLTITTNDNGNTGSGGAKTDADTVTITVNSVNDAPTLTATAANSTFTEGAGSTQAAEVGVFSAANANTIEAGQTITGLTLTVGGIHDGASEKIVIDGTSFTLGANASGTTTTNGMSFTETIAAGVATIVLSKAAGISAAAADTLINGITYQDTNVDNPTPGDRTITLTQIKDNGGTANGGDDTTDLTIASTVHVNAVNDAPTVFGVTVDGTGITFSIADPDSSSFTLVNTPSTAAFATAFGNPLLSIGSNQLVPTEQTSVHTGTLQVTDGAGGVDDVIGLYLGTSGANTITVPVAGSANAIYGFGGTDTINLATGNFVAGTWIDGGSGIDTINLTTTGDNQSIDFTVGNFVGIENLVAVNQGNSSGYDQTFTVTAAEWAGLSTINMNDGSDTLNVVVSGTVDISAGGAPTLTNTETVHITGTAGDDTITLSGTQLNAILSGTTNTIDLGGGTDTINLTSTSTVLNGLSNAALVNVEAVSAASATGSVTINLSNQTEAINITGSSHDDVITASAGGGTINAGAGADTITINAGTTPTSWTVDLGTDSAADKIVFNHTSLGITDNTVATVSHFDVNLDKIAVTLNGTAIADGAFQSVTATQTNIAAGTEVVELANPSFVVANLTDDSNGGLVEAQIAAATNSIANGTYTFILYSNNTSSADAGIYTVTISDNTDPTTSQMTVEHIMTLSGVGIGNLGDANFVATADPIVLDLGTPGIAFSSLENGVQFDINGDGVKDQVAWTVGGQDGILALDLNGSGKIESGNELFTPTFNGGHFANGIAALASLDANHDGVIDAKDPAFSQLLVWQDANHNGVSDAGELTKLSDLGITSINLTTTQGTGSIDGQNVPAIGNFTFANGSQGSFVEANLDTTLGTTSTAQHHSHAHSGHGMPGADALKLPEGAAASIVADFHHGHGNIDLSSLGQPAAEHHQHQEHHGQGGEHHLAAASMPMPAAIALMHEEAHRAAQAAHH